MSTGSARSQSDESAALVVVALASVYEDDGRDTAERSDAARSVNREMEHRDEPDQSVGFRT